jgi:tetratricopeptide (TPR) repeat protein
LFQKYFSREISLLFLFYLWNLFFRFTIFNELSVFPEFIYPPPSVDSDFYIYIGKFINGKVPFVSNEAYYYSPLYSHIVALFFSLFGENLLPLKLLNIFLGSTVPIAVYLTAKLYFKNKKIWFLLMFFSSFYDAFIIYDLQLLKTSLGIVLLFWGFYFLSLFLKKQNIYTLILSGTIFGLASLIYVNFLLVLVGFCLYLLIKFKGKVLYFGIPIFFIVSLSMVRNYIVMKDIVPVTSIGGIHFYIGNNSKSIGIYTKIKGVRASGFGHYFDGRKVAEKETGKKLKPSEVSKFWKRKAVKEIKNNPKHFVKLIFRKVLYTVNYFDIPNNINKNYIKTKTFIFRYFTFSFGIFSLFGLVGFILSFKDKEFLPVHLFFAIYFVTVIMFFVTDRYRLPLILPLFLYTGYFIDYLIQTKQFRKKLTVAALTLVLSIPVFYPTKVSKINFKMAILQKRIYSQKLMKLNQRLKDEKNPFIISSILTKKASIYIDTKNYEQAHYILSKAVKLNPKNIKAKYMLNSMEKHVPNY